MQKNPRISSLGKTQSAGRQVIEMHSALKSGITICMTIWEMLHVFSFPQNHYTDANRQNYFFNSGSHSPTLIDTHAQEESQALGPELVNQPIPSDCFLFVILHCLLPKHLLLGEIY